MPSTYTREPDPRRCLRVDNPCRGQDRTRHLEAHHYCTQLSPECIIYDSDSPTTKFNGIEYIASEKLFDALPAGEKPF